MSLLFNSRPLVVDKDLATMVGLNGALVLQQIHYWLEINRQADKNLLDGRYWTYNTVADWQEQFPFLCFDTVKRTLKQLREKGVLLTGNYNKKKMDRTLWYAIDYDRLEELEQEYFELHKAKKKTENTAKSGAKKPANGVGTQKCKLPQCKGANCTNAKGQSAPMQKGNLPSPIPETNTETNTEIPSIDPAPAKPEAPDPMDVMEYGEVEGLVRENIEADFLATQYGNERIEEIVLLITDTLCSTLPKLRIGRQEMHREVVRSRLLKLDSSHVECVLEQVDKAPGKKKNMRAYLLTALYNAPTSSDHVVRDQVNLSYKKSLNGGVSF